MATLNIGGKRVKVDDAFLSLPPDQQQATVDEIAASMGGAQPAPAPVVEPGTPIPGGMTQFGEASDNLEWANGQQPKPTFAEEATSLGRGMIEGIPVLGPTLSDWQKGSSANIASLMGGGDADRLKAIIQHKDDVLRSKTGGARTAGQIGGSIAALAPLGATALGGKLLGMSGGTGLRVGMGAGSGAVISGADTAARGGSTEDILRNTALGAGLGTILPAAGSLFSKAGQKAAQSRATSAAIKGAPDVADLKATAKGLFENSRAANAGVKPDVFEGFAAKLVQKAQKADIDETLDGDAVAAYRKMVSMAQEAMQGGQPLTFGRLHNLRQIAQDVAVSATKDRTKRFADDIVNGLDDMINGLKPDQIAGQGGKQAANDLLEGISVWSRAKKLGMIEEAITKAGFQKSGLENGLRLQFLAILRDPKKRKLFSAAEIAEIEKVANGTAISNIATLLGKFGFGTNGATNMLGGTIGTALGGAVGGWPAAIAAGVVGTGARKLSETMAVGAANRAAKAVATPNLPVLPKLPMSTSLLAPAVLPLAVTRR